MPALDLKQAAKRIGVSSASVANWVRSEHIPAEKVGRKVCIEEEIVDAVKDLRSEHGKAWPKFAAWNGAGGGTDGSEEETTEPPAALNAELLKLAKKYRALGHEAVACKLYDALLEQYDF